jgi:hypothetical protein
MVVWTRPLACARLRARAAFWTILIAAACITPLASASAQPPKKTIVIIVDPRTPVTGEFGQPLTDAARDAVARSIDVQSIDVSTLGGTCVASEVGITGSSDEDVLLAARKCSGAADKSGEKIPRIDFVALLQVESVIENAWFKNDTQYPKITLRARLQDVVAGTFIAAAVVGGFPSAPFPDRCDPACRNSRINSDVAEFGKMLGTGLATRINGR